MHRPMKRSLHILPLIVLAMLLAGCGSPPSSSSTPTGVAVAPTTEPSPTAHPTTPPTSTPAPSPTSEPSPTPAGLSDDDLQRIGANELGWVPVLEYHLIESPDADYSRSPAKVRQDLERLYALGFYPITFRDLASGHIDVPAGKSPVVLTFDDSSDGQFRYLPDGSVDPTSAWGIMQAFHAEHPDWPVVATFFPLIEVDVPSRVLFGQPEYAQRKLQEIVRAGGEVGSHTYTHMRLDLATADQIQWQLAYSAKAIEDLIGGGYKVTTLSLPLGMYPEDESLLRSGESEGVSYSFIGAAEVAGGASPSPFSTNFDPYHIRRIQALDAELDYWLGLFEERPDLKFISDGDPTVVTVPVEEGLPEELQGILRTDLPDSLTLRRYTP
ncbi:MAG: xylanase [Herpetosiphonaceae bacterium]|nr:MAG: xylanase [Herpetosiphonaceae bacterium]